MDMLSDTDIDRDDLYEFYNDDEHPENTVWEVNHIGYRGELLFSFDKKKIYNLWQDYPHNFTPEEKEIFDREYPYWADFFKARPYDPDKSPIQK